MCHRLKKESETEEELRPGFIESISDPYEIEKIAFDLVKSAKDEVMVLFSTANAFKRQERAGLMRLLQETKSAVTVRILMPALELEKSIKGRFDENQRIKVRYFLHSALQTNLSKLVVDKKIQRIILTRRLEWQHTQIRNQLY